MNYNFRDLIKKYCTLYQNNTFITQILLKKKYLMSIYKNLFKNLIPF